MIWSFASTVADTHIEGNARVRNSETGEFGYVNFAVDHHRGSPRPAEYWLTGPVVANRGRDARVIDSTPTL